MPKLLRHERFRYDANHLTARFQHPIRNDTHEANIPAAMTQR